MVNYAGKDKVFESQLMDIFRKGIFFMSPSHSHDTVKMSPLLFVAFYQREIFQLIFKPSIQTVVSALVDNSNGTDNQYRNFEFIVSV